MLPTGRFQYCSLSNCSLSYFFFFNDTATTEIYTLSLHDALPILGATGAAAAKKGTSLSLVAYSTPTVAFSKLIRSEEHTSELQSPCNLVCRLLLEKKKALFQLKPSGLTRASYRTTTLCRPSPSYP